MTRRGTTHISLSGGSRGNSVQTHSRDIYFSRPPHAVGVCQSYTVNPNSTILSISDKTNTEKTNYRTVAIVRRIARDDQIISFASVHDMIVKPAGPDPPCTGQGAVHTQAVGLAKPVHWAFSSQCKTLSPCYCYSSDGMEAGKGV